MGGVYGIWYIYLEHLYGTNNPPPNMATDDQSRLIKKI